MWSAKLIMMNLGKAVLALGTLRLQSLGAVRGMNIRLEEDKERKINMCKAIEEMRKASIKEGRINGQLELLAKGLDEGLLTKEAAVRLSGWSKKEFVKRMNEWRKKECD